MTNRQTVVVLGASDKPERYSNQAVKLLKEHGHEVIPIHPRLETIEGCSVVPSLAKVEEKVDTLTVYVGPLRGNGMIEDMKGLNPSRVILNPGTESEEIEKALSKEGISVLRACTLVMLRTGQFDLEEQ